MARIKITDAEAERHPLFKNNLNYLQHTCIIHTFAHENQKNKNKISILLCVCPT